MKPSERQPAECLADGCGRKPVGRGLCGKHYQAARTAGELPPIRTVSIQQRLLRGSIVDPASGCWLWQMSKDSGGYGLVTVGAGMSRGAHRESYRAFIGPIPPGAEVCHRCDTPACIRPGHLFLGSHRDNMADASRKWRIRASLTRDQVRDVRESTESVAAIAERLGVGKHVIYKCRRGDTYPSNELLENGK